MNKAFYRVQLFQQRKQISIARRKQAENNLLDFFSTSTFPILSFFSLADEINLLPLNKKLAEKNFLYLPRVEGKSLGFYRVLDITQELVLSPLKIFEPNPLLCQKLINKKKQTVLVPGLGFAGKNRLGYGLGYYDRFFAQNPFLYKIGVGFREQKTQNIVFENHDQLLDEVLLF